MNYLIYSKKHSRGIAVWWRPASNGYTQDLNQAGRYSKEEAEAICKPSRGMAVAISESDAALLYVERKVDFGGHQNADKFEALTGVKP